MPKPEERVYDGLAQVAHAIRRSTALNVATMIMPPETTVTDLLEQAEVLAKWIGGQAAVAVEQESGERPKPLGEQWPPP
jgi:hypothetical protein